MKKVLLISLICAAACSLSACTLSLGGNKTSKSEYDELNSMLSANYSQIEITIKNNFTEEDITLESKYTVKYSQSEITVEYRVERFTEFTLENPETSVKTVYEGTAVIVGGVISGGEDINLTADIARLSLTFKEELFENVTLTGMYLDADVKNASGFLGTNISCTDMHVYAEFLTFFYNITVNYRQSGHEIEYSYVFTR